MYKALCRELDELLIEILENCHEHIGIKVNIEKSLHGCFHNIAKTRYINGSRSVTTMQLPTENSNIKPCATIYRNNDEYGTHFTVKNNLKRAATNSSNGCSATLDTNCDSKATTNVDPIRLFGILVPQSLRLTQKLSILVIDQAGEAAEVQMKLQNKIDRYSKLLELKKKLK